MFRPLKTYQLVVDVTVAGLFGLLSAPTELRNGPFFGFDVLALVLVLILLSGALALRRLSPGLALAAAWAGAIVQMAAQRTPGVIDLAIFAVLYATAAYGSRLVFWLGFASTFVGAVSITVYVFAQQVRPGDGLDYGMLSTATAVLIASLFALGLAWTIGALVRTGIRARAHRAAQVRAEAEASAELERVRIARDMHDVVAHSLAVVVAQADGARYAAASDPAAAAAALETISTTARSALSDVRLLLTQLRHSQGEGPQPTIADLEELYAQVRSAGVELRVDVDPAPAGEPPAAVQLAVYRILQEALTNALRHGAGGAVAVRLAWHADRVELAVRNPVRAAADAGAPVGHGLIGMRERAQLAGGRLVSGVHAGVFAVEATIPLEAAR